ncbi:Secreted protein [Frankia sp. AiPs1]|uniref:hypothetical protein n=1 Tax=Frankia sp. AiPa1 TaxID=573492 RepID=UPI00202AD8AD|nr:hypothetical protein [Frankia sp. AiPa1]MCL9760131.1 hypothetical protein [Frankia sp. AiPa1]
MTGVGTPARPSAVGGPGAAAGSTAAGPGSTAAGETAPRRLRRWTGSPPGRLRVVSLVVTGLLIVLWAAAYVPAWERQTALRRLTHGPGGGTAGALVAAQGLRADLAGADAAATRARLGGDGDEMARQRAAYQRLLVDAGGRIIVLARVPEGRDSGEHRAAVASALTVVAGQLARYGAEVARAGVARSELMWGTILPAADRIVAAEQAEVDRDSGRADQGTATMIIVGLVAVGALAASQVWLLRRTNRILNPALAAASILAAVATGWALVAFGLQHDRLADGRDHGYRPLIASSQARVLTARVWTDDQRALLDRPSASRLNADSTAADARLRGGAHGGLLAEIGTPSVPGPGPRVSLSPLWADYQGVAARVRQLVMGPGGLWTAAGLAQDDATAAFERFDVRATAVDAASAARFEDSLTSAAEVLDRLPVALSVLLALAAVLTLAGFQVRINDYR